ncbi:uncharacterized protein PG986_012308 [Apiospora aurea]|uniref:Uncharacterized protein n=1 Tax=Apiospora aurea TaxID=335848 RepID=A0ABR1PZL9_9PEZI
MHAVSPMPYTEICRYAVKHPAAMQVLPSVHEPQCPRRRVNIVFAKAAMTIIVTVTATTDSTGEDRLPGPFLRRRSARDVEAPDKGGPISIGKQPCRGRW